MHYYIQKVCDKKYWKGVYRFIKYYSKLVIRSLYNSASEGFLNTIERNLKKGLLLLYQQNWII